MTSPIVSVIIPCYNAQAYMREALASAFAQQYDGEIQNVIVDDASPDDTWSVICEVVEQYTSTRDIVGCGMSKIEA